MKKICAIALSLTLILSLAACGGNSGGSSGSSSSSSSGSSSSAAVGPTGKEQEAFWLKESVAIAKDVGEMASSPAYVGFFSMSEEIVERCAQIGAPDYGSPTGAYLVPLPEGDALVEAYLRLAQSQEADTAALPQSAKTALRARMTAGVLGSMLNGMEGTTQVAAISILTTSRSYQTQMSGEGESLLLITYPGDYHVLASFVKTGDGVISATAVPVPSKVINTLLDGQDLAQLTAYLTQLADFPEIAVTQYTGEELAGLLK